MYYFDLIDGRTAAFPSTGTIGIAADAIHYDVFGPYPGFIGQNLAT